MPRELRKSKSNGSAPQYSKQDEQQAMGMLKQFEGMSENDLMSRLISSVAQGKQDGTFSEEMLSNFIKQASPMLTDEQRNKMNEIAEKLK